jgi:hypothetical protein
MGTVKKLHHLCTLHHYVMKVGEFIWERQYFHLEDTVKVEINNDGISWLLFSAGEALKKTREH